MAQNKYDICLVQMPYSNLAMPSLALSLLKALLQKAGLKVKVLYPAFKFADLIGLKRYQTICEGYDVQIQLLTGDWTFANTLREVSPEEDNAYLNGLLNSYNLSETEAAENLKDDLLFIRSQTKNFVESTSQEVLATGAKIIACSSVFQQHVASLSLLKHIKSLSNDSITMLGGANCENIMGITTHQQFPWLDYVVTGEADEIIVPLCKTILNDDTSIGKHALPKSVLGPSHRQFGLNVSANSTIIKPEPFSDLDKIPAPCFDDFFEELENSSFASKINPCVIMESSRGCWWGAKHHCTFCGLNGNSMEYRSKSAEKFLNELDQIQDKYNISRFNITDNILDMGYFKTVIPKLEQSGKQRQFFYEIKSSLSEKQMASLRRAGISWVQPGIETLHSDVLKLMDKGVQGWRNIQLLKWGRYFGIYISWNILWGFPDENDAWHEEQASWLPYLIHLQAPDSLSHIVYNRFSPLHFNQNDFGLELEAAPANKFIYGFESDVLNNLTYYFSDKKDINPFEETVSKADLATSFGFVPKRKNELNTGIKELSKKIKTWQRRYYNKNKPALTMKDTNDILETKDSRFTSKVTTLRFSGIERAIILACDRGLRLKKIPNVLKKEFQIEISEDQVSEILKELSRFKIILYIDERYLTVAIKDPIYDMVPVKELARGMVYP